MLTRTEKIAMMLELYPHLDHDTADAIAGDLSDNCSNDEIDALVDEVAVESLMEFLQLDIDDLSWDTIHGMITFLGPTTIINGEVTQDDIEDYWKN